MKKFQGFAHESGPVSVPCALALGLCFGAALGSPEPGFRVAFAAVGTLYLGFLLGLYVYYLRVEGS